MLLEKSLEPFEAPKSAFPELPCLDESPPDSVRVGTRLVRLTSSELG